MEYSDTNNQLWLVSLKHAKTNEVIIKANSIRVLVFFNVFYCTQFHSSAFCSDYSNETDVYKT